MSKDQNLKLTRVSFLLFAFVLPGIYFPCSAEPFKASAQVVRKITSLDPRLSPGKKFKLAKIKKLLIKKDKKKENRNNWYKIPTWFSGCWRSETATLKYSRNYRTGMVLTDSEPYKCEYSQRHGDQVDRQGQIWQKVPFECGPVIFEGSYSCHFVLTQEPMEYTDNCFKIRSFLVSVEVDSKTSKIIQTHQAQSWTAFTRSGESVINKKVEHKAFDWNGEPIDFAVNEQKLTKYEPFSRTDSYSDFVRFLKSKGLQHLVP